MRLSASAAPLIGALLIVDSLHFVFARILLPLVPPLTAALFVLAIGTAEVGLFSMLHRRIDLAAFVRQRWFFLSIGFCVAASTALNYTAVAFIDPGTASLLAKAEIAFTLSIGIVWLGDQLTRTQGAGALLALFGVAMITFQPGDYLSPGAMMVLGSAFLYALHAAITKRYGGQIDFVDFFFFRPALHHRLPAPVCRGPPGVGMAWRQCLVGAHPGRHDRCGRQPHDLLCPSAPPLGEPALDRADPQPGRNDRLVVVVVLDVAHPTAAPGRRAVLLGVGIVTIARSASDAE